MLNAPKDRMAQMNPHENGTAPEVGSVNASACLGPTQSTATVSPTSIGGTHRGSELSRSTPC